MKRHVSARGQRVQRRRLRRAAGRPQQAARGTGLLVPPTKDQRKTMPAILQKVIVEWRNRVEATFGEITDVMELARQGVHTSWDF